MCNQDWTLRAVNLLWVLHQVLSLHQTRIRWENEKSLKGSYHLLSCYNFFYVDSFWAEFNLMLKKYWELLFALSCSVIYIFKLLCYSWKDCLLLCFFFCASAVHCLTTSSRNKACFWMVDNGSCSSVGLGFSPPFPPNAKLRRWVTGWTLNVGSKQWHPPFMIILSNFEWVRERTRRVFIYAP